MGCRGGEDVFSCGDAHTMTVKEMREILSLYPGNYEVWFESCDEDVHVHRITEFDVNRKNTKIFF